jgi:hypothetical protein
MQARRLERRVENLTHLSRVWPFKTSASCAFRPASVWVRLASASPERGDLFPLSSFRRDHAGRRRPAPACRKNAASAYRPQHARGTPNPTQCRRPAQRFSCNRDGMLRTAAARPAWSRRNADLVCARGALDLPDRPPPAQAALEPQVGIGRSKNSAASPSQCVRVVAKQLERLMPRDTSRSSQLLLAAPATEQRRGGRFPPRSAGGGEPAGRACLERIQKEIGIFLPALRPGETS